MYVVYLLTNIDKDTQPNKYIGSKSHCKIVDVDGIPTMIDVKTGKPYFGSSTNQEMRDDLKRGDRFSCSVLEEVSWENKKHLREMEDYYLKKYDVGNSEEYYNITDCAEFRNRNTKAAQTACGNSFGELAKDIAGEHCSMSKRDGTAKRLGFTDYGALYLYIYEEMKSGKSGAEVSHSLGLQRHFASRYLSAFDMDKAYDECQNMTHLVDDVRSLWWKGATLAKISEILGIEKVTARFFLGKYSEDRSYGVAYNLQKTKEELEIEITKAILDGEDFVDVAKRTGLVLESVKRYFLRCVRRRLKSSDL